MCTLIILKYTTRDLAVNLSHGYLNKNHKNFENKNRLIINKMEVHKTITEMFQFECDENQTFCISIMNQF